MQIEEAIKELKKYVKSQKEELNMFGYITTLEIDLKRIDTVLDYIDTMQKEFERLEGIEDNTAMLKYELEKKEAEIDKYYIPKAKITETIREYQKED